MHKELLPLFIDFQNEFLIDRVNEPLRILEVGSKLANFRLLLRDHLISRNWEFVGLDLIAGRNVDVVSEEPYKYPFEDNSFDVVLSGSTLEHVEDTHKWIREVARVTNDLVWILVPNFCKEHRHPVDCWRILPDGMRFLLATIADMEVLYSEKSERHSEDTIGIAKKL